MSGKTGKSILIVEDEMVSSLFLAHCVKRVGHLVAGIATTGEEAIVQARDLRPDLVLMDVGLKGVMNGVQAAHAIYRAREIPIVFVTAYTREEILRYGELPDVYDYLPKPVNAEQLETKIRGIFDLGR